MTEPSEIPLPETELKFRFLPAFARFILENKLREFTREQWKLTRQVNFPALKYYDLEAFSEEEIIDRSIETTGSFLRYAAENRLQEQLHHSIKIWVSDQLPVITRDQVVVEDITLSSYIRKQTFLHFIPSFTNDVTEAMQLICELDRLILETESISFYAFSRIQEEKITNINRVLQEQEEQLLEAQAISSLGSFEWKLDGGESIYTPELYRIFELEPGSGQNLSEFLDYVYPGDRLKVKKAIEKAINGDGHYECEYRYKKKGNEKVLWSRGLVIFSEGKAISMKGTVMDITDRHYMLQRLQRNEELYKQAQKLTHIGNWAWNMHNGRIILSDELCRIYGLNPQPEEMNPSRFFGFVHPDDQEKVEQQWNESLKNLSAPAIDFKIQRDDGSIRIIHQNIEVLCDEGGNPYKIIGTGQDLTQEYLLTQEVTRKNKELERSNKELTSFSYVVSHDLQEPLRKIKTFSDLILEKDMALLSEEGKQHFDRIMTSAQRMQKLIDDLLSFSRTQSNMSPRESTDLNEVLEETTKALSGKERAFTIDAAKLPVIKAISFQMRQLFENIIGNSIKYSKPDVAPFIKISWDLLKGKEVFRDGVPEKENYHRISFADNGIGFDQKHSEKIFEVFQRLHGRHEFSGTGIGLAICKKIAENHFGFIQAKGKLNEGAVFEIYLPVNS
ncbi:MAG: PAS domain-containing protein [Bacteroidia bacterium]